MNPFGKQLRVYRRKEARPFKLNICLPLWLLMKKNVIQINKEKYSSMLLDQKKKKKKVK